MFYSFYGRCWMGAVDHAIKISHFGHRLLISDDFEVSFWVQNEVAKTELFLSISKTHWNQNSEFKILVMSIYYYQFHALNHVISTKHVLQAHSI